MSFRIRQASVRHLEAPIEHEVVTAFGTMTSRHAVFLTIEDDRGNRGIGESWVNFPHWGPWERVAAFERTFIPYLGGGEVVDVGEFIDVMYDDFRGPAIQSETTGPLLMALCAIELALWDVAAKREGKPLSRLLFDDPAESVQVYASGINAPIPFDLIDGHLDRGVSLFKLKLGFGDDADRRDLDALAKHLDGRGHIAVDVNRGWTLAQALDWLDVLAACDVRWIEEPLHAEEEALLTVLHEAGKIPIAMGENVMLTPGANAPDSPTEKGIRRVEGGGTGAPPSIIDAWRGPRPATMNHRRPLQHRAELAGLPAAIVQPDLTKYAPLHLALAALPEVTAAGKRMVPHFLGSAPGQAASIHFASGCPDTLVELDINRNPLRTELMTEPFDIEAGRIRIPEAPGLGWTLRDDALK